MGSAGNQPLPVSYPDVAAAAERLAAWRTARRRSPHAPWMSAPAQACFSSARISSAWGIQIPRAYNALSNLNGVQQRRGVVAYSSGNHAQAVALAGNCSA